MMKKLLEKVNKLVGEELEESNKNNPPIFHSAHEGYGVIAEEVMEAKCESSWLEDGLYGLLCAIRNDDWNYVRDTCRHIREDAINMACECIQVAAMCDKMIETVEANVE